MTFSTARKLEIQFTKSIRKGYVNNVELNPDCSNLAAVLDEDEICVAKLRTKKGGYYYFTNSRIFFSGIYTYQFIQYDEIHNYFWITDSPDINEKSRLKRTHYDKLILERANGEKVVLEGLDQAAFCLIKFFNWILPNQKIKL